MTNEPLRTRGSLQHSKIVMIGLGGIGSIVSLFLSQFLHSLKRECTMFLVDGDSYEPRNQERMLFSSMTNKAMAKSEELAKAFPEFTHYRPVPDDVTVTNIGSVIGEHDLVFLCVDNHATRLAVSRHCEGLQNVILISGSNDGVEEGKDGTFGNVQIFIRSDGNTITNALTRFHPEIEHPAPREPRDPGCDALSQGSAPQLLFTNLAVASAMLNTFRCCLFDELTYEELYLSISKGSMVPVRRKVADLAA